MCVFKQIKLKSTRLNLFYCLIWVTTLNRNNYLIFSGSSMGSVVGFNSIPTGVIVVGTATN